MSVSPTSVCRLVSHQWDRQLYEPLLVIINLFLYTSNVANDSTTVLFFLSYLFNLNNHLASTKVESSVFKRGLPLLFQLLIVITSHVLSNTQSNSINCDGGYSSTPGNSSYSPSLSPNSVGTKAAVSISHQYHFQAR